MHEGRDYQRRHTDEVGHSSPSMILVQLDADLATEGSVGFTQRILAGENWIDSNHTGTIYNLSDEYSYPEDAVMWARWSSERKRWEVLTPVTNDRKVVIGKLDGALAHDGTATVSIWEGDQGSEADSGDNITVAGWLIGNQGDDIASGTRVKAEQINGTYYVTAAACEADT